LLFRTKGQSKFPIN